MSSVGKKPLSLQVSLGLKCVMPAHAAAAIGGTDRELSTPADSKSSGYKMMTRILPWGNRAGTACTQLPACLPLPRGAASHPAAAGWLAAGQGRTRSPHRCRWQGC